MFNFEFSNANVFFYADKIICNKNLANCKKRSILIDSLRPLVPLAYSIISTQNYVEAYEHSVPGVQENEFHVQAGSEHEHIAVELDLGYCAGGERVTDSHQTHVLITAVKRRHV